ncbi:hypothetical protein AB0L35_10860 [Streptomyces sp. NPDC052309]|uniref:hypothetical protein n=1 Tax=Streptomyces sp. NPDC052309 TaxID=3155421 RepID=UPI00343E018C
MDEHAGFGARARAALGALRGRVTGHTLWGIQDKQPRHESARSDRGSGDGRGEDPTPGPDPVQQAPAGGAGDRGHWDRYQCAEGKMWPWTWNLWTNR